MTTAFPKRPIDLKRGLLLVGHGTRDERGLAEFRIVAGHVKRLAPSLLVESCFLEIAPPDIAAGVQRLLAQGVQHLTIAPLLLFAAGHALRDIPEAVQSVVSGQNKHKAATAGRAVATDALTIDYLPPLECHERIIDLSAHRFEEALLDRPTVVAADTLLLLVGRGSSYPAAIDQMHRFAQLRSERTPVGQVECCFVAIAKPTLAEGLLVAAQSKFPRIVVQPHVLFTGQVLDEIQRAVVNLQSVRQSGKEWLVAPCLGPSPMVAEAVLDLARRPPHDHKRELELA